MALFPSRSIHIYFTRFSPKISKGHFLDSRNMVKRMPHLLRKLRYSLFLYCFAFCRSESWKDAWSWVADIWGNSSWANGKLMPGLSPSQTHALLARLLVKSKKHIWTFSKIQPQVTKKIYIIIKRFVKWKRCHDLLIIIHLPVLISNTEVFNCLN